MSRQGTPPPPPLPLPDWDYSSGDVINTADTDRRLLPAEVGKENSPHSPGGVANMSVAVLTLIVVVALCAIVGAIYLLIYFKSIKPMSARSRSYNESGGSSTNAGEDGGGVRAKSAHPFFRHK